MIHLGDSMDILKTLADNSVDSVVTDPPYGLKFMGKTWDYDVPTVELWREVLRVLKPGGHLLSFGGTRTYHRMVVAIEDAGFEIRDQVMWIYGSGFPKSLDVSKAIDKAAGVSFKSEPASGVGFMNASDDGYNTTLNKLSRVGDSTDAAKQWQGWGTALKPAQEIICMARKPLTGAALLTNLVLECQSKLFALIAKKYSASNPNVSGAAANIAQWLVEKNMPTPDALSEVMVTLQSASATISSLNTELSWLDTLDGIWTHANTCTTEMESSLITDLKILKSLLSSNTQANTLQNDGPGEPLNVSLVASLLSALALKLNFIQEPFAQDHVTSPVDDKVLHPNSNPIVLARKPLEKGLTVASNVLKWGVGAINVDAGRIATNDNLNGGGYSKNFQGSSFLKYGGKMEFEQPQGRWPANVLFDEDAAAVLDEQSGERGLSKGGSRGGKRNQAFGMAAQDVPLGFGDSGGASRFFYVAKASKRERNAGLDSTTLIWENDAWEKPDLRLALVDMFQLARDTSGEILTDECLWSTDGFGSKLTDQCRMDLIFTISTALKLITELKTSSAFQNLSTRESIQDAIATIEASGSSLAVSVESISQLRQNITSEKTASVLGVVHALLQTLLQIKSFAKTNNFHSTVKPIKLMEYLVKLVTPPGGVILDPFMGSGSTGVAAKNLNFEFVGIEREAEYVEIATKRIEATA